MNDLVRHSKLFVKRNASTILTCVGGVGVVATSVLAVKATPKALYLLDEAKEEKGEELTKMEVVRVAGPVYIPAVITGVSTLACIFGANILNQRQQAAITSAYALVNNSYKEYKKKVEELYGEGAGSNIRKELAKDKYEDYEFDLEEDDGKQLFYDDLSKRYFRAKKEDVVNAAYQINKKIQEYSGANVNEYYDWLGIEPIEFGERYGWTTDLMMASTWSNWLSFYYEKVLLEDGMECEIITMSCEPEFDYEYY